MEVASRRWWVEALRAGLLLEPRSLPPAPSARMVLGLIAGISVLYLATTRAAVPGPAGFDYRVWFGAWWSPALVFVAAWALYVSWPEPAAQEAPVARWFVLGLVAGLPVGVAGIAIAVWNAHLHWDWPAWAQWALFLAFTGWAAAAHWRVARTLLPQRRAAALTLVSLATALASSWFFPQTPWYPTASAKDDADEETAHFRLDQETFERQQALLSGQLQALPAHRGAAPQVWGIVFAPYAAEDVFLRESTVVAEVLAQRFDARGRVIQLVNHGKTAATHPWATPLNLRRTIDAVAARMDRKRDVLALYLTSHGARDFKLSAWNWPLQVEPVTPASLRKMLDTAGIRYRVIAISACFSGGWIEPLASESTLIMTAADAEHTSYGCGKKSELTYFGRAVFDEQLRRNTRSFEDAFGHAVPVIREREQKAGKPDGFSNPQLRIGADVRPVLAQLQGRLDRGDAPK